MRAGVLGRPRPRAFGISCLLAVALACAGGDSDQSSTGSEVEGSNATSRSQGVASQGAASQVPLATRPADGCGWIPAAEAEAIIGPFAAPPRPSGSGCLYTLTIPPEVAARQAKIAEFNRRIGATLPSREQPYAVVLEVGVGVATGERAQRLAGEKMASWLGDTTGPAPQRATRVDGKRATTDGWDAVRFNGGRLGTIDVSLISESSEIGMPLAKLRELSARVRDRIPDLPFAMPAGYPESAGPDPCTLLTRAEAEPVLGRLVVAPYRSGNGGPLAAPTGESCAYYTAGHHVLVVTPHRSGGKDELAATRGFGKLMGIIVNDGEAQSADTIEGSWDETAISADGRFLLRKGDRAVDILYETSSTDKAGALRLGGIVIERLAAGR